MLPPGHIAAGYLAAEAILKFFHPDITAVQARQLVWWGMWWSFAPDLDSFVSYAKEKAFFVRNWDNDHRKFFSHAPLLWMFAGLLATTFARSAYWKMFGILVWLGSWSHFFLDSIEYGVMWLWPFSKNIYAFKNREQRFQIEQNSFWRFWMEFLRQYSRRLSAYLEIFLIISALIIYFK